MTAQAPQAPPRSPMRTGYVDRLIDDEGSCSGTDGEGYEDPRNDLAEQIMTSSKRIENCCELVSSYAVRFGEHEFTHMYAAQLNGYIRDYMTQASNFQETLRQAVVDDWAIIAV